MTRHAAPWSRSAMLVRSFLLLALLALVPLRQGDKQASAYTVLISEKDELRQSCSGVKAGKDSHIEALFDKGASGTVATIFYEFQDFDKIGKGSHDTDVFGFELKTYVCTTSAAQQKLCDEKDLGNFILDETAGPAATVHKERLDFGTDSQAKNLTYPITRDGYYCFGATAVPLTSNEQAGSAAHAIFAGRVTFYNNFDGNLPASEYPKLNFYFALTSLYALLGLTWLYLCIRHRDEILPVQHFISGTIVFLIIEMFAQWCYYYYLDSRLIDFFRISSVEGNASVTAMARFLLVLTSILDAARNSVSFFLLLIVAMGYGVIRPSIGPVMTRVRILTAVHFIFGVLYSVGIVLIQIDQGGAWIFIFIFPLAMTLTAFLMWIMNSLNHSIEHLTQRKQTFKRSMFVKLHRILLGAVVVIFAFFVISSIAFSQSGGAGFAPNTWPYRWFLLDGWLGSLYFIVFAAIAWVWRPTGHNMRLAMSDELATDDDPDAEGYEVDTFAREGAHDSDDEEAKPSSTRRPAVPNDAVVFEIGDDDEERGGLMHARQGSQETLVNKRADKND